MKKILNTAANGLWIVLIAPALSAFFARNGWHDWLLGLPGVIYDTGIAFLGEDKFPWVAGILLGVSLGAFLHKAQLRYLIVRSARQKRIDQLKHQATSILTKTHLTLGSFRGKLNLDREGIPHGLAGEIDRFFLELQKLGVETPDPEGMAPSEALEQAHNYIGYLRNFLADEDVQIMRQKAGQWLASQAPTEL